MPENARKLIQAEERMRSVVNHVIDGIITIDERGIISTFNPAAERIFGYDAKEVVGQNVRMLMPEPYHSEHDQYISNFIATGEARIIGQGREVVGRRKDGSTFPMDLAVSQFHIGENRFFTGIVRDISDRKRLERELHQRLEELAEADRQKNEFLAMLAHELRNPLAPLRNAVYLLKMPGITQDLVAEARDMMERQLHQLVRLVDDLLDLSRIIRGKIDLQKELVKLDAIVARAIEIAQPAVDAQGHELVVRLPDRPMWLEADLVRMAQVVANLLMNAAKYTDHAGQITLTAEAEGGHVVITVRDNGVGIPAELLARIFDLFMQGDRSLARSQGGLGIGLTLVKRLVELHGGTVHAASEGAGRGSEFTVRVPAASPPQSGATPETSPSQKEDKPQTPRKRVMVVDDNVDAADSMVKLLKIYGFDSQAVYDGASVLGAAQAYRPDVIVLDIGLPGMSGYDVARKLRGTSDFERTPLVAVTGYGQDEDRTRALDAGFDYHLTKPVDPEKLRAFIVDPFSFR